MIILHSMAHPTVFAFFGHPGAGKSTLLRRFAELTGVAALDTDAFMTAQEVAAVKAGRYTQAMRLANIDRYCERVRTLLETEPAIALADGLPNAAARRYLCDELPGATVVFLLVSAPRALWQRRLATRRANAVDIGIAEAEAYVRDHWQPIPASFEHEQVENGADATATDALLIELHRRYVSRDVG
jgi:adenylate kinase family enzyme